MPKHWLVLIFAVLVVALGAPAMAGNGGWAEEGTLSAFNRDLINKVKHSCIYIGIMAIYDGSSRFAGSGSGVIIMGLPEENAALAITNHHVAGSSVNLQIETWNHTTYKAEMLTTDPGIDAALIKIYDISPSDYEVAVLGNSDEVQIGEAAVAVGAPGANSSMINIDRSDPFRSATLQQTTTMSVVSGIETSPYDHISFHLSFEEDMGKQAMTNLPYRIVSQAVINRGNSGGPLFNSRGELIGLNHATGGRGGTMQYFTIPINSVKRLVFGYLDKGVYELPWFGMDVLIPPELLNYYGYSQFIEKHTYLGRLEVYDVRKGSTAERGGLKKGDIMEEFDGRVFPSVVDLRIYVFNLEIGKQVPVVVKRGGRDVELTLEVGIKRTYDSEFSL